MAFELRDGVFKRVCLRASAAPARHFFLVIDEINRGDIPRIFGELLTSLEKSRRGQPITLPVSGGLLAVPPNVFVIGTMNTADRSIALLDAALRRRFGFIELMPDSAILGAASVEGIPLGAWLDALNARVVEHVGRDARNLQVGHTYLMHAGRPVSELHRLVEVLRDDIIPLLEEYCYEDYAALEAILGPSLVSREKQRVHDVLFQSARAPDLVQALLAAFPEVISSAKAVAADAVAEADMADDDEP